MPSEERFALIGKFRQEVLKVNLQACRYTPLVRCSGVCYHDTELGECLPCISICQKSEKKEEQCINHCGKEMYPWDDFHKDFVVGHTQQCYTEGIFLIATFALVTLITAIVCVMMYKLHRLNMWSFCSRFCRKNANEAQDSELRQPITVVDDDNVQLPEEISLHIVDLANMVDDVQEIEDAQQGGSGSDSPLSVSEPNWSRSQSGTSVQAGNNQSNDDGRAHPNSSRTYPHQRPSRHGGTDSDVSNGDGPHSRDGPHNSTYASSSHAEIQSFVRNAHDWLRNSSESTDESYEVSGYDTNR